MSRIVVVVLSSALAVLLLASSAAHAAGYGDWNGDGVGDVLSVTTDGRLLVYHGDGTGTFADNGQQIGGASGGWDAFTDILSPGDFTGDGRADLLVRSAAGDLSVFRGNGAGGFDTGTLIGHGWGGFNLLLSPGDFSGDGRPDVLARDSAGRMWLYRGDGAGGFQDNGIVVGGGWGGFIGVYPAGDFDSDGRQDVFARTASGLLYVYRGNGLGSFLDNGTLTGGGWSGVDTMVGGSDFTGDGRPDLLVRYSGTLHVYRGAGNGGFADNGTLIGNGWGGLTAIVGMADFNSDGKRDVLGRMPDGTLRLYRGDGAGGFIDNGQPVGWSTIRRLMAPGDFNGDGKPDLLTLNDQGQLWDNPGNGAGALAGGPVLIGNGWGGLKDVIAPGDFDGDGHSDVLATLPTGEMRLYRGDGVGGFVDNGIQVGGGWGGFRDIYPAGDFDGDGYPDVFARTTDGWLDVYRGNGRGSFADNGTPIGLGWGHFTALASGGDFSGDGIPDVLARAEDGAMWLYRGNGHGGFVDNGIQVGGGWNGMTLITLAGLGRWPTSWRYGGANHKVDTIGETLAVVQAMDGDAGLASTPVFTGLAPADQSYVYYYGLDPVATTVTYPSGSVAGPGGYMDTPPPDEAEASIASRCSGPKRFTDKFQLDKRGRAGNVLIRLVWQVSYCFDRNKIHGIDNYFTGLTETHGGWRADGNPAITSAGGNGHIRYRRTIVQHLQKDRNINGSGSVGPVSGGGGSSGTDTDSLTLDRTIGIGNTWCVNSLDSTLVNGRIFDTSGPVGYNDPSHPQCLNDET